MAKKFQYKEKIAQVEKIISHLKADDVDDVEAMLSDVQEATAIINDCRKHLEGVKTKLDEIINPEDK